MPTIEAFVRKCLDQATERYVYGAEVPLDADLAGVQEWDCSELVQVCAHQAGGFMPDGSAAQLAYCQRQRATLAINEGERTRGALLFVQTSSHRHVAVSLGDGRTIEARGRAYGVNLFGAMSRGWTHAARVPGFTYPPRVGEGGIVLAEALTREEVQQLRDMLRAFGPLVEDLVGGADREATSSVLQYLIGLHSRVEQIARSLGLAPAE